MNTELQEWASGLLPAPLAKIETLRPEASFRAFFRLILADGTSTIAMHAPPDREDAARFVRYALLLRAHAVPVPAIRAKDEQRGFVLMEDLGATHFIDVYRAGNAEAALDIGIDMLPVLQNLPADTFPTYTAERLTDELGIFSTWFVQNTLNEPVHDAWLSFAAALVSAVTDQPFAAVHRDYHCKNLLLNDGRLGIVDFQDALTGPALYDLASLLRDCYWSFDEPLIERKLARYLAASPLRFENPLQLLNLTALQRQLKAIGIFSRLKLRDGKPSHIDYIDSVLAQSVQLAAGWTESGNIGSEIAAWLQDLATRWSKLRLETDGPTS